MLENLLTLRQYATLFQLNLNTVTSWVQRGQLPIVVIAGRKFVSRSARPQHNVRVAGQAEEK